MDNDQSCQSLQQPKGSTVSKSATNYKKNAFGHNRQFIANMHANSYAEGGKKIDQGIDYGLE